MGFAMPDYSPFAPRLRHVGGVAQARAMAPGNPRIPASRVKARF